MPASKILRYADCKTEADFRKLAAQILRMREDGTPWDGASGIVAQGIVSGAPQGRDVLRKHGKRKGKAVDTGNGIAKSYDRTDEFRQAESERRQAKAEAQRKAQAKADRAAKRQAKAKA